MVNTNRPRGQQEEKPPKGKTQKEVPSHSRSSSAGPAYDVIVNKSQSSSSVDQDSVPTFAARINPNNVHALVSFQQPTKQPFKGKTQKELPSPSRSGSAGSVYDVFANKSQSSSSVDNDSVPTFAARINPNNVHALVSFQQATKQPFKEKTQMELPPSWRPSSVGSAYDLIVNEHRSSSSVDHDSMATSAARINQNNFSSPVPFQQATKQRSDPKGKTKEPLSTSVLPEYKRLQPPPKASPAPAPAPKKGEAKRNPEIKFDVGGTKGTAATTQTHSGSDRPGN